MDSIKTILDPRTIPQSDFPFIVSKGGGIDLMSRLIRWRTNSWCEHSMLAINPGKFVWEDTANWYGEGPMEHYMVPNVCLKFYQLVDMNPASFDLLRKYVATRISSPWYDKIYDWVGILGEAIGFPKIHTPGLEYCSVDAIHALGAMVPSLPSIDNQVIRSIPSEENPGYLDLLMLNYPKVFRAYGTYQYDNHSS